MSTGNLKRTSLIVSGTLGVALGVFGIFLPLLPTTPFLLLAAMCYARSSERLYHWLITSRWFGEYIKNYREGKGIPLRQKVLTIIPLWLSIGYAVGFVVPQWWVKVVLLGIAMGVTIYLVRIKTFRSEDIQGPPKGFRHPFRLVISRPYPVRQIEKICAARAWSFSLYEMAMDILLWRSDPAVCLFLCRYIGRPPDGEMGVELFPKDAVVGRSAYFDQ